MEPSTEIGPGRPLAQIAEETIERYRELFVEKMLPDIVEKSSNAANTQRLAEIFLEILPEDPSERELILNALGARDPLMTELIGPYNAYQSSQGKH